MFRRVLVPLDGSDFAETALPLALAVVERSGATLELVSTVKGGESEESERRSYLNELARRLGGQTKATVETELLRGDAADALVDRIAASGPDLVVLSTHGRGALERAWRGSVADELVRRVRVPLLLVPSRAAGADGGAATPSGIGRIVLALDGSEVGEATLEPASALASAMGASVMLVRVERKPFDVGAAGPEAGGSERGQFDRSGLTSRDYLDDVARRLEQKGVQVAGQEVTAGSPAPTILNFADSSAADVITMATHGRGGVRRMLVGSVSEQVLQESTRPLLIVRPAEKDD